MNPQGLYFYTDPHTQITHFLEFQAHHQIALFETSGFLMDFLLASHLKTIHYKLTSPELGIFYKGVLSSTFQKLKRRKKPIQEISFEYNALQHMGIINPLDKQIALILKIKGKKSVYRVYSWLDKTVTTKPPLFLIGDRVATLTEKGHTYREGTIFKYEWHYLYKEWMYFIVEGKTKEQPKRYFAWDLKRI